MHGLAELTAPTRPPQDWVCRTALDVARGLAHLHGTCRLVHRDVSTNNILLCPDPSDPRGFRAKLSDFGLATALADRQTHSTSQLKGTVDFMPPGGWTGGVQERGSAGGAALPTAWRRLAPTTARRRRSP